MTERGPCAEGEHRQADQLASVGDQGVESLISEYETLITQTEQEIRENEEEEARQYEKFCERVRSMEERGTVSYWSVLFKANSFSDLLGSLE